MKLSCRDYRDSLNQCDRKLTFCFVPKSMREFHPGATIYQHVPQMNVISENELPALTKGVVREFRVFFWYSDSMLASIPAAVRVR